MRVRAWLAAMALANMAVGTSGQDVAMQYRWIPGKTTRLVLRADLSGSMPLLQSTEPVDLEAKLMVVYQVKVLELKPDGQAVVQFRVESADADVAGIPISVPMEDAHKVLDRTVTFAPTGAVIATEAGPPLPFTLSIPGVDPQRLYALVCPVVFPDRGVKVGDTWEYRSELLGTEGAPAQFRARVLRLPSTKPREARELRVAEEFTMEVDQKLDADKKPPEDGGKVARTRKGNIQGSGVMVFDPKAGSLLRGQMTLQANITETIVGETPTDEPAETTSKVKAVLRIEPAPVETQKKPTRERRPTSAKAQSGRKGK